MQPPEKPRPYDCCGNGCFPCVYDLYAEELKRYNEWLRRQPAEPSTKSAHKTASTERSE